jgi:NAD(P)-dependent dehydrogenase (short-subunit alcohol dehydrogenase family)
MSAVTCGLVAAMTPDRIRSPRRRVVVTGGTGGIGRAVVDLFVEADVASTAGRGGAPYTSAYTASKHAAIGLMRAVAAEFAGSGAKSPR